MTFSEDPINTLENLISKNKTKSISIYLVLILAILLFLIALPLIKVDISSQSRGMIRSTTDNVPLSSVVNGKVTFVKLKNNQVVQQGDTLIRLTQIRRKLLIKNYQSIYKIALGICLTLFQEKIFP